MKPFNQTGPTSHASRDAEGLASHKPLPRVNDATEPENRDQCAGELFSTPRPNPDRSDLQDLAQRSQSKSPVAGHVGIHHVSGEPQYHYSIAGGLKTRQEGTFVHQFAPDSAAQPMHERTTADVARAKYADDRQGGNSHVAQGFGADLEQIGAGQTRLGQGKQASNKVKIVGGAS
jgi:hypothetical protein